MMKPHDRAETIRDFQAAVNMTLAALRKWLATDDCRGVGMKPGGELKRGPDGAESVGHHMGERILALKATKQADLTDADLTDMRKVVGYVHRHMAQRPAGDVEHTRWRMSLMNWGQDPLK